MLGLVITFLAVVIAVLISTHYTWWRIPRPWKKGWPRVLMYHHIWSSAPPSGMSTSPKTFERHIRWLVSKKAVFCTLSELADKMNRNEEGRFVALTFDDGYVDNCDEAFPIVQKYGAKMTVFINPGKSDAGLLQAHQIQMMQQSGCVEFGAHTLSHVNLTTLDDATARHEISASKVAVEQLTGKPCTSFAYPYGRFNQAHMHMVGESGMPYAVSIIRWIRPWSEVDPLAIPRVGINGKMNCLQFSLSLSRGNYRV